jgi:bifunctional oligoribonuclease and PAP phosphatase NrnA
LRSCGFFILKTAQLNTAQSIAGLVESANNIIITAHKSPDGDSIGSSVALWHFLRQTKERVTVVHPDPAPEFLHWLEGTTEIVDLETKEEEAKKLIAEADLVFCLDYNEPSRVGKEMQPLIEASAAKKVMIDHHTNPSDFADILISKPEKCSTAQMIFEWIAESGQLDALDVKAATAIYLGIMTDTGSFRFPSVEPKTHEILAELIRRGVVHNKVHENVYDTNTIDRIRLRGYALSEKLVMLDNLPVAYVSLSFKELDRFNYRKGDTEGLVNQILGIAGMKMAVLFTEKEDGVKLSLRSKDELKVNELAADNFEGGGHIYAAGGVFHGSLEEAIERFVTNVPKYVSQA